MADPSTPFFQSDQVEEQPHRHTLLVRLVGYLKPYWLGLVALLLGRVEFEPDAGTREKLLREVAQIFERELWRIAVDDGEVERITDGHHYLSGWHAVRRAGGGVRVAAVRSDPTALGDVHVVDLGSDGAAAEPSGAELCRVTRCNDKALEEIELRPAIERWVTVDGRELVAAPVPPFMLEMLERGGLIPWAQHKLAQS